MLLTWRFRHGCRPPRAEAELPSVADATVGTGPAAAAQTPIARLTHTSPTTMPTF